MATAEAVREPTRSVFRNRPLMTLFMGHFTIDMYGGMLPILFPILASQYGLDLATVGLISLAYSGMGSISQPIFGWLADRYGTRLTGAALIWTALMFGAIGFAPSFTMLVILAGLAGLGSGAFHPFGALNASAVIDDRQRNSAMSVYTSGGTVGFALAPLIGVGLVALAGLHGISFMILPGVVVAAWLLFEMRAIAVHGRAHGSAMEHAAPPIPRIAVAAVIIVMMARSWTMSSISAYVPSWYESMRYSEAFYGALATTITLASALGTLGSGSLADRYGRRALIIGSLAATIPAILLFAQFTGPIAFLTGALTGILAASTAPLLLVLAQQLMAGRAGIASGLILGLGFVTGAIGIPITGALADAFGFAVAMRLQIFVLLIAIPVAFLLPTEARVKQMHDTRRT